MNARARLASGCELAAEERDELERLAEVCDEPHPDFWTGLVWPGCPARIARQRDDIEAALTLRGLAALAPLSGWPDGYAAWVVETWAMIEAERRELDEANGGQHG